MAGLGRSTGMRGSVRGSDKQPKYAGRSGYKWRKCITFFRENHAWVCSLCGGDIPKDVDHSIDKLGHTLHHIIPLDTLLKKGLDPYDHDNLTPAHRSCNSSRGLKIEGLPVIVSRQW